MPILVIFGNIAAAVFVITILTASGERVRGWLRFPVSPLSRPAVNLMLGGGILGFWVLLLGLAGGLGTWPLVAGLMIQAAFGCWSRPRRPPTYLLTAAVAGLPNLLIAAGPPHFFDAMVYHLGLPWQALMEGAWAPHPENLFASFPPLSQLISAPLLSLEMLRAPALLHWWAWVVAATAAAGMARSLSAGRLNGHLIAAAVVMLPVTPLVPGFPAAEGWFLAALVPALSCFLRPRVSAPQLPGGMLLLGLACACRAQGVPWLVITAAVWLVRVRNPVQLIRILPWAALGASPWWLKNWVLLGNPILPFGDTREGIETLWRDGGSLLLSGGSPWHVLTGLISGIVPMLPSLVPVAALAAACTITNPRSRPVAWATLAGTLAWAATGILPRFFAPVLVLLLVIASSLPSRRSLRWLAPTVLACHLLVGAGVQLQYCRLVQPMALLPMSYVEAALWVAPNPPFGVYEELGDRLGDNAHVLVVGEARGFGLTVPFTITSQHDVSPVRSIVEAGADAEAIAERLLSLGFTHLIVNERELQRLGASYPVVPWRTTRGEAKWLRLLALLGHPIAATDGVHAYALTSREPTSG